MAILHLTNDNFKTEALEAPGTVLVDFWASWCGPCRQIAPILEQVDAQTGDDIRICKVDVDENEALAGEYGVMSIPTLIVFRGGKIVGKLVGVQSAETIKSMLTAE